MISARTSRKRSRVTDRPAERFVRRFWEGRGRPSASVVCLLVVWLGAIASLGGFLASSQANSRTALAQRFQSRMQLGAEFVSLYTHDLFDREHDQATSQLAGRHVSGEAFAHAVAGLGMSAAVLLDRDGRLLQVVPAKPALLGHVLTHKYAHLAAAVAGHAVVSNVVPSAVRALPVVALAEPYPTASGRRVFSGAYDVSKTPLRVYLKQMIVTPAEPALPEQPQASNRQITAELGIDPESRPFTAVGLGTPSSG